jgi:FixJ family two-component response regulator
VLQRNSTLRAQRSALCNAALIPDLAPAPGSVGSGASNKEIADRLNLAEGTVKNHVTNILTKLDVRDRTQAAIRARQLGIA